MSEPVVHFVGFRGDEYARARRIWRGPRFIHRTWDRRAKREIAEGDVVLFAAGDEHQPVREHNGNDLDEGER